MDENPGDILARLEELRKYQDEQQQKLLEKQTAQREQLRKEQSNLYGILGFTTTNSGENDIEDFPDYSDSEDSDSEFEETNIDAPEIEQVNEEEQEDVESSFESEENSEPVPLNKSEVMVENNQNEDLYKVDPNKEPVSKKPFLKRGEGLKTRFRVDPDAFKLDNLPKYKYANLHKEREAKKITNKKIQENNNVEKLMTKPNVKLVKQPPKPAPKAKVKKKQKGKLVLDLEKVQNKKLITNKSTLAETEATGPLNKWVESNMPTAVPKPESSDISLVEKSDIPWNNILQKFGDVSTNAIIKNIDLITKNLEKKKENILQDDSINAYEILERKTDESDFCSNTDSIIKFIRAGDGNFRTINDSSFSSNDPVDKNREFANTIELHPRPQNIFDTDSDESSCGDQDNRKSQVRFSDKVIIVNQMNDDDTTDVETNMNSLNIYKTSTPKHKFANIHETTENHEIINNESTEENTIQQIQMDEIREKTEMMKDRLKELESEIESYKKYNSELIRIKQQHELDKLKLEQEREEMKEKLQDERIKMEVYFHDERMRIEEDRQKALKDAQKPNKKDRQEIEKLKDQIAELEKELKTKESKHGATSSRYRAQIKNLEKDLKEAQLELEVTKKENKKIDAENSRLRRENNNKMLLEINKNLAKLANNDKEETQKIKEKGGIQEKNVKIKVATAKVVSHRKTEGFQNKPVPRTKSLPVQQQSSPMMTRDKSSSSSSFTSSEDEENNKNKDKESMQQSSSDDDESTQSAYFSRKKSKRGNKENDSPLKEDLIQTPILQENQPRIEELTKNLRKEVLNEDGSRNICYPNGNLKIISPDGFVIKMIYFNKDIKETNIQEGTTKYYYAQTNTWHTTYMDGLEILEFPDGQTEHRYKDGSTEVHFSNGSIRITNPNSQDVAEEWKYPDGSTVLIKKNDDKVINLPNGQIEIHTKAHKRRIYPDGTVKLVYPDGSQESRYSNGRVRLKDKDGKLISDTGGS